MDEEDDDFYDPADAVPSQSHNQQPASNGNPQDEEEEEEVEVEDDEVSWSLISSTALLTDPRTTSILSPKHRPTRRLQKCEYLPDPTPILASNKSSPHPRHANLRNEYQRPSSVDSSNISKSITPSIAPRVDSQTPLQPAKPTGPQKPGSAYPAIHSSTIDVNANPIHPATGKPITSTDLDNDFSTEDPKPWRRPGSDISDYFNYGFDEFTWASYCLKQQELRREVGGQKKQVDDMQAFLSMGMPPMPGQPPAGAGGPAAAPGSAGPGMPPMPAMPGMPEMSPEIMQGMLGSMMAQGLDPSSMDPMAFMQHAQAMMGQGGGQGQQMYGYDRGGYSGRGRGRRW